MAIKFLDVIDVSGTAIVSDTLTVTATGGIDIDTAGHASLTLDRASTSYDNNIMFRTNGDTKFRIWQDGNADYLYIRDDDNATNMVTFKKGGDVGIGTTAPLTTLDVNGRVQAKGINSKYICTLTFGTSANWYRVMEWTGSSRGGSKLILSTTGGNAAPNTYIIKAFKTYGNPAGYNTLKLEQYGGSSYLTKARMVYSQSTAYLEVYKTASTSSISFQVFQDRTLGYDATSTALLGTASSAAGTALAELPFQYDGTSVEKLTVGNCGGNSAYNLSVENSLSIFSTGDTAVPKVEGHLLRVTDTANDNPDVEHRFVENHSLNYGFSWFMDGGNNNFSLRRHDNSANGTTVFRVNRSNDTAYFAGNVGIGTTSPLDKLHVSSGMIRVEGAGCGIRMPDTSGNPLLALTTDQNTFAGCNIVNGWGNSSNTGVGVGTTRSDGTAFQVRTGVTLSSGIATSSGTQRLIVYGNGGTKITKSLGVGANASTTTGRIDASNDVVAYSTSDIRLKDNIKSIDKALDKVNSIQGIEFDGIEKEEVHGNSGHDIGVIAQEIEKILPDVVTTRDSGYKAVKYEKIVPLLIEAIKDLSRQVDGLKRLI